MYILDIITYYSICLTVNVRMANALTKTKIFSGLIDTLCTEMLSPATNDIIPWPLHIVSVSGSPLTYV